MESNNNTAGNRNSAATIDHEEVHVDLTKRGKDGTVIHTSDRHESCTTYNVGHGEPSVIVQTMPDPKDKPKNFVVTSCFVVMLCNCVFGLLGWHYGSKSENAWQLGDEREARMHAKRAKIFVILGVITGICTYVLALTLFFTVSPLRPGA